MNGLAVVLLHIAGLTGEFSKHYWNVDDLNCCLDLINRKFVSILQSDDHVTSVCIYDTLNIILNLIASMGLAGIKKNLAEALHDKF